MGMDLRFTPSADVVAVYDFVEVTIETGIPIANPFRTVWVSGAFGQEGGTPYTVDGFCDSPDGSVYRIRFMPVAAGEYDFAVVFQHADEEITYTGQFQAQDAGRKGMLKVDPNYPYHFLWAGTGEHYFWNGTTAYAMAGLREDRIAESIDRLDRLGINRIRVALSPARVADGMTWCEPVYPSQDFSFLFGPWLCARPDSVTDPGWDVTRFDVAYWQKFERLVRLARDRDMVVSVIFFLDAFRPGSYPFPRDEQYGNEDEERYYHYAAARFAAYSNVMWDITNEWKLFRTQEWVEHMGALLTDCDPYGHITSCHGHEDFPYRTSSWADYAMFQIWDDKAGYAYMLNNRQEQTATGRPMPQINEEYAYEDHYPGPWIEGKNARARKAETRLRIAWEISMAGCYQTTGEYAGNGLGGWLNGRGDDSMTMLPGYARMKDFFTSFDWWKLEPHTDLAQGAMCLAEPGVRYVIYLSSDNRTQLSLDPGDYTASWYNPRTGKTTVIGPVTGGGEWQSPATLEEGDFVLLLEKG